jgi:hypothetical protein
MHKKMRHSKFRNTGILFELLARQITADILAGKNDSDAKTLLHKYFRESTELGKEWQLYSFLLTEKAKDESKATRMIEVVLRQRAKLSNRKLSEEKYNLIREVKNLYPIDEFLKAKIHNYRVLASLYKLFEDCSSSDCKFHVDEVCQAKECLVEHVADKPVASNKEDASIAEYQMLGEDVKLLAYKFLIEGLNKKYNDLDDDQRDILREYITNIANTNSLGSFISSKVDVLKEQLAELAGKVKDEENVIKIKIEEVINQVDKIRPGKVVKDSQVTAILLGFELLKEIRKNVEA